MALQVRLSIVLYAHSIGYMAMLVYVLRPPPLQLPSAGISCGLISYPSGCTYFRCVSHQGRFCSSI
ncbi:hypothetical protein BDV34DRAFT_183803 [Aspergillus parasiticus]|uniref:Uncharacterized protein n=1 Tax=Aspergillus parasiticus TaxID=5067 RepID=A0A5N6E446_ASPPA|nr:hypothetical protein BDV34DRAFT_183803 [Aspergillus parasiticus]